jgi:phage shock protein A
MKSVTVFQSMIVHELKHPIEALSQQHDSLKTKLEKVKGVMSSLHDKLNEYTLAETEEAPLFMVNSSVMNVSRTSRT